MSIHISTKIHVILFYIISDSILYHIISNFKDSTIFEIIAFLVTFFLLIWIMSWIRITKYPLHPFLSYPQCNKILTQFLPISFLKIYSRKGDGVRLPSIYSVCFCLVHGVIEVLFPIFFHTLQGRRSRVLPDVHSVQFCLVHSVAWHYLESSAELFHVRQRLIASNIRESYYVT